MVKPAACVFGAVALMMGTARPVCAALLQETLAPTTLLEDAHNYFVSANGHYQLTQVLHIRINQASALEGARVQTFPFNERFETVQLLHAYVQRPGRRRLPLAAGGVALGSLDQVGVEQVNRDLRMLRIAFPALQVGDELYVKIRTASRGRLPFPNHFVAFVTPVSEIVQEATSLTIDAPASFPLRSDQHGFIAAQPVRRQARIRYHWTGDGSANTRLEADAADASSFRKGIVVSSFTNFSALARVLDPYYRRQARPSRELARLAASIADGAREPRERALAIHRWVQQNIQYRAIYDGSATWIPQRSAGRVLHERAGDCKDHVVLLSAMLAAVGIESTPALIDWGLDMYTLPQVAHQGSFNHVITFIPSLNLYLEATAKDNGSAYLPPSQLDKVTLLTRTGTIGHTPAHQLDRRSIHYAVAIAADRSAQFTFQVRAEGYRASQSRRQFGGYAQYAPGAWVNAQLQWRGWKGEGTEDFGDTQADLTDYTYSYAGRIDAFLPTGEAPAFTASTSLTDDIGRIAGSLVREKTRTQPFVCDALDVEEHGTYTWPSNFDIGALPADVEISTPVVRYRARYRHEGNGLAIDRTLQLGKTASAVCSPADFEVLGPAMLAIQADTQQPISLTPAALP